MRHVSNPILCFAVLSDVVINNAAAFPIVIASERSGFDDDRQDLCRSIGADLSRSRRFGISRRDDLSTRNCMSVIEVTVGVNASSSYDFEVVASEESMTRFYCWRLAKRCWNSSKNKKICLSIENWVSVSSVNIYFCVTRYNRSVYLFYVRVAYFPFTIVVMWFCVRVWVLFFNV